MGVNKVTMAGFRGATAPVEVMFDPSKPVTLIFGENGTGKSTIADAFDFLCNRSYGSLENYSLGEPPRKHVASLGVAQSALRVTMTSGYSAWEAVLGKSAPVVTPDTGCPDARILRRRAILKIIEAQPKQRFEELKAFIVVPNIERSEGALREAIRLTENRFNECTRALGQAKDGLEKLWRQEGGLGLNAVAWAEAEGQKDISQLQESIREAGKLDSAFEVAVSALASLDTARDAESKAVTALAEAEEKQKAAEAVAVEQNAELLSLLQDARIYVDKRRTLTQCPVCEGEIEPIALLSRLAERIKEMQGLKTLVETKATASKVVVLKSGATKQARKEFCEKVKNLGLYLKSSNLAEVTALGVEWNSYGDLFAEADVSEAIEERARQMLSDVTPCRTPLRAAKEADQRSLNLHNALMGHVEILREKQGQAKSQETLVNSLRTILEIVSKERKDYVESILVGVSDEVERLYGKLHPGEGIGGIKFYLKPSAIGSLEFDAHFVGVTGLPPQAYYSESHLDTLGICVFLALSKLFKTNNTIVILDDVLTSVDGDHLDRFMALLHEEAAHFSQMIVTTHYRPWRDRYRWAKGPSANTQVIELGPWSLQTGLQVFHFLTAAEELRKLVGETQLDRQAVASKAGIVLESLLDFITLKYHCAVPRNARNEYTLGDLVRSVDSKLSKELRCCIPETDGSKKTIPLRPLLDVATGTSWIRNTVGCHFSPLGSEITDQDVREFAVNVLMLADHLICPSCRTLPTRRPSGSCWECACRSRELHPLIYPGADPGSVDDEF